MIFYIRDEEASNMVDAELYVKVEDGRKSLEFHVVTDIPAYTDKLIKLSNGCIGNTTNLMFVADVDFLADGLREEIMTKYDITSQYEAVDTIRSYMTNFAKGYDLIYVEG